MEQIVYLKKLGFGKDPFSSTNADKEEMLSKYFIAPDYYDDIWGDPDNPTPNIIYGPRGSGKTAQRNMIDKRNNNQDQILTINYSEHDLAEYKDVNDIDLNYHIEYLNRLLLVATFNKINSIDSFTLSHIFKFKERQYLYKLSKRYLSNTPFSFHRNAVLSLKTIEDLGIDVWESLKKPITALVQSLSKSKGVDVDLSDINGKNEKIVSHKENFRVIIDYLNKLGYKCIYILIDKVDENDLTGGNNAEDSFSFISPLLKNLEILETDHVAFKFFLWDELKIFVSKSARPDRVFPYFLEWNEEQLEEMLNRRVHTYSEGNVSLFSNLFQNKKIVKTIILFANRSPRDCIRICKRIISEQERIESNTTLISDRSVDLALGLFIKEKVRNLIPDQKIINRLRRYSTTIVDLKILVDKRMAYTESLAREVLHSWIALGILDKIGTLKTKNLDGEDSYYIQYAFNDIRIAKFSCPNLKIGSFIEKKIRKCTDCGEIYIRDFEQKGWICPECSKVN